MKVFIDCSCDMLQKSLEMFLAEFIVDYDSADMIISDEEREIQKPLFLIGGENSDLKMPFDRAKLIEKLLEYDKILKTTADFEKSQNSQNLSNLSPNSAYLIDSEKKSLEDRISGLIDNFKNELIKLIKENKN